MLYEIAKLDDGAHATGPGTMYNGTVTTTDLSDAHREASLLFFSLGLPFIAAFVCIMFMIEHRSAQGRVLL